GQHRTVLRYGQPRESARGQMAEGPPAVPVGQPTIVEQIIKPATAQRDVFGQQSGQRPKAAVQRKGVAKNPRHTAISQDVNGSVTIDLQPAQLGLAQRGIHPEPDGLILKKRAVFENGMSTAGERSIAESQRKDT